jgi:thioredoxin-like negative regulator of GroEL
MKPIVQKFLEENTDVEYIVIDTDDNPGLAIKHGIKSVPTFISYVDGVQYTSATGAMPLAKFRDLFPENNQKFFKTSNMESASMIEKDAMGREMFWKDIGRP